MANNTSLENSEAYTQIKNLCLVATWHKKNCRDEHCMISLYQLRNAAVTLAQRVWAPEKKEVKKMIAETQWS